MLILMCLLQLYSYPPQDGATYIDKYVSGTLDRHCSATLYNTNRNSFKYVVCMLHCIFFNEFVHKLSPSQ